MSAIHELRRQANPAKHRLYLIKKLDKAAQEEAKLRDSGLCQWPGCTFDHSRMNACHFVGRGHFALRWWLDNIVTLCVGRHFYTTKHPDEFAPFMRNRLGPERYAQLIARKEVSLKTDVDSLKIYQGLVGAAGWRKIVPFGT